jgi:hypothetical protein
MFVASIGRKWCYLNESHFQNNIDAILYFTILQWSIFLVFESLEFSFLVLIFLEIKWQVEHVICKLISNFLYKNMFLFVQLHVHSVNLMKK